LIQAVNFQQGLPLFYNKKLNYISFLLMSTPCLCYTKAGLLIFIRSITPMIVQFSEPITTLKEQRFTLPGDYSWEQFEALETLIEDAPGLRITYLDGCVEFMTLGEDHEQIKSILAIFIGLYFFEKGN
jgi:hypothetical protein